MKWNKNNLDELARTEKIFRKSRPKASETHEKSFILTQKEWDKQLKEGYTPSRVVEVHKKYLFLAEEPKFKKIKTRELLFATVARKHLTSSRKERNFVCVGDRVLCRPASANEQLDQVQHEQKVVDFRLERTCKISRQDPMVGEREHVLACNMDQLVVVASYIYPTIKWGLIDRYLVIAEQENLAVTIMLNKADLLPGTKEEFQAECKEWEETYRSLGYKVVPFQANLDNTKQKKTILKDVFGGKISLVSGQSGVGKSSIVNLLGPEIHQPVETEEILKKGRHTTSYACLLKLSIDGFIIDTPGIRSFALNDENTESLSYGFREFREYLSSCRYRACAHESEPGCAVIQAVEDGKISKRRYQSYRSILTGKSGRQGRLFDV